MKELKGELFDKSTLTLTSKKVSVKVKIENGDLCIYLEGYGESTAEDGHGCPLLIEIGEGELRVIIWDDINTGKPEIINLEGAREELRK